MRVYRLNSIIQTFHPVKFKNNQNKKKNKNTNKNKKKTLPNSIVSKLYSKKVANLRHHLMRNRILEINSRLAKISVNRRITPMQI